MLHGLLPGLEGQFREAQFAYRRDRGAEFHLLTPHDCLCRELTAGKFAYLSALDTEGAFDRGPHFCLLRALSKAGVDSVVYVDL